MLEEMREPRPADPFVLRTYVVPLIDVDNGQFAIDMQDDLQTVGKRVLLVGLWGW